MILRLEKQYLEEIMNIWLETNIKTHDFIAPAYWKENYEETKDAISQAETYVYIDENDEICGFIGMVKEYVAGIFIKDDKQSKGYGKELINHVKGLKDKVTLKVYKKNILAVNFYLKNNFMLSKMENDQHDETEYHMTWNRDL